MGDLTLIAFYFLLRLGEYTAKMQCRQKTRTHQFWRKDITFFKKNAYGMMLALPANASVEQIMEADAVTLVR